MTRARLKAVAVLAAMTLTGAVLGMALMHAVDVRRFARLLALRGEDPDAYSLELLTSELRLQPDQHERIQQIQRRHRSEAEVLTRRIYEDANSLTDRMSEEIAPVLTPHQQNRYREIIDIQKARLRRRAGFH